MNEEVKTATPRTEEQLDHVSNLFNEYVCKTPKPSPEIVPADFARQLEGELTTARIDAASWKRQFADVRAASDSLDTKWRHACARISSDTLLMQLMEESLNAWQACAERLAESLMANMRHNNNVHGHACTVGTRDAHDEFVRLKGSPLTPALSPHPMKGAGEEPSP